MGIGGAERRDMDVVLDRDDDGSVHVSVPRRVRHYHVDSFEWGHLSAASAELALNILAALLPPGVDGEPGIRCEDGECSAVAWRLHRAFMADFLAGLPASGGCLMEADMRRWIQRRFDVESPAPINPGRSGPPDSR